MIRHEHPAAVLQPGPLAALLNWCGGRRWCVRESSRGELPEVEERLSTWVADSGTIELLPTRPARPSREEPDALPLVLAPRLGSRHRGPARRGRRSQNRRRANRILREESQTASGRKLSVVPRPGQT